MIAGLLGLLDEKRELGEKECDELLAQSSQWLQETVEQTKKQLLYSTCAAPPCPAQRVQEEKPWSGKVPGAVWL
jgi:hypothetical protein